MDRDEEHLKILSICHYVYAGLLGLFSFGPLIYVGMGVAFLNMPLPPRQPGEPGPEVMGYFLIVIGLFLAVMMWALAACVVAAGRFLKAGRNRVFCIVVAAFSCLNVPLGTILGVFTLIVLSRRSVADSFAHGRERDLLPAPDTAVSADAPLGPLTTPGALDVPQEAFGARDEEHLKILSICHFVFAGLIGLFSLFFILYFGGVGLFLMNIPTPPRTPPGPDPALVGYFFVGIGLFIAALMWGLTACLIAAGRFLRAGRNRVFCMIVAGFSCMQVPLGSALGVFTLIVLSRPSVVEFFAHGRERDVLPAD